MSSPVMMQVTNYPLPLLCRFWHGWTLDHQTWGWDYYTCKRCTARKVVGPPSDEANMERMDTEWVLKDWTPPGQKKELISG